RLVHVSTDFVFDGSAPTPRSEDAPTGPLGVYGSTKREGEIAVLSACPDAVVLRTSWVYGPDGKNFVRTILRRLRDAGDARVVSDQIGSPTSTLGLARAVLTVASDPSLHGLLHYADLGVASWYDLAQAIAEEGARLGWFVAAPR